MEQPTIKNEEALDLYLKGKSEKDLASIAEDPFFSITTDNASGEARPTDGFDSDELKQRASSELESRRSSVQ
jgi:hypothetical protein